MKYLQYLLVLPLGLSAACSDATTVHGDTKNNQSSNSATGQNGAQTQGAALFQGAGTSGAGEPLAAEIPPSTAHDCVPVGISAANPGPGPAEVTCYYDEADDTDLAATLERRLEIVNDQRWLHLRLTFNPTFVDNSYGETAIGWGDADDAVAADPMAKKAKKGKGGHTFKDLVGSDHAEFQLFDSSGELTMQFKVDYIEPVEDIASGYACAGVTGGEGEMVVGEADWILGATTSLDRNLNGCGLSQYLVDSPATDESYTPNPDAPSWDYRVVYEVWVAEEPFGDGGFGDALIEYVHASPSKRENNTLIVVPGDCDEPDAPDAAVPPPSTSEPSEPPTSTPDAGSDEPVPTLPPPMAR